MYLGRNYDDIAYPEATLHTGEEAGMFGALMQYG
jgi:hypothetical protein